MKPIHFSKPILGQRSCRPRRLPGGEVGWRMWAPRAGRVELVLFGPGQPRFIPMAREEDGHFFHLRAGVESGDRYGYRLDGGPIRPDPNSLWQPEGVHRPSALYFPEQFTWTDAGWRGVPGKDLVFYELHVGTFTAEGTFEAVIPRLPELRELGVTALEIMPVAQFPGTRNWGYDGVHLYAAQHSYGGPHGLQKLVDAAHGQGLAVILDVVYNHFGPEGNYIGEFGPYYSDHYHTPWGSAFNFDGRGSDSVRAFVLDNVACWIEDFHLDGLRLDAVHAMYDTSPRHILREVKEVADQAAARRGGSATIIAESLLNDVRMLLPPERGGYGLDAEWNEDFHHALLAYLTGERHGKYVDFGPAQLLPRVFEQTFHLDGIYSHFRGRSWGSSSADLPGHRFVIGVQNHDHIGNRARGDRVATLVSPGALRLAASLMLLSPYLPLIFMGEEYGEENPFLFFCSFDDPQVIRNVRSGRRRDYTLSGRIPDPCDEATYSASRLSWSWPPGSARAGLRNLYRDLLAARRRWPALRETSARAANLLPEASHGTVLELIRGGRAASSERTLSAYFNLTAEVQPLWGVIPPGQQLLLSTADPRYTGDPPSAPTAEDQLAPYECKIFGKAEEE